MNPLILLQKRLIRILSDARYYDTTTPLFYKMGILKLEDLYKFNVLLQTRKRISSGAFETYHSLNTRNRHLAVPEFQRLSRTQQSCNFIGPKLWNELSSEIRNAKNLSSFKSKLRKYFISQYSSNS